MAEPDNARMARNLTTIGWSSGELARRTGLRERTVRRMLSGSAEIPPNLASWLDYMAAYMLAAQQQPEGWNRDG